MGFLPLPVTEGTSDVCREDYGGPSSFFEPEARNIRDFYLSLDPWPEVAMPIHNYQQTVCEEGVGVGGW